MALMTCAEFRILRDQFALNGYYERWPVLNEQRNELQQSIAELGKQICLLSKHTSKSLEDQKVVLQWKLQDVIGQMAMIEADAPIRKARLGIGKE